MVVNLRLGDTVRLSGDRQGFVKYVGQVHFADGKWVGVELTNRRGTHDGMVKGKRYFRCKNPADNRGIFVKLSAVRSRVRKKKRRKSIFAKDFDDRQSIPQGEAGNTQPKSNTTSSEVSTQSGTRQRRQNSTAMRRKRSTRTTSSTNYSNRNRRMTTKAERSVNTRRSTRSPRVGSSPRARRLDRGRAAASTNTTPGRAAGRRPTSPKSPKRKATAPRALRNATSAPGRSVRSSPRVRSNRSTSSPRNGHKRTASAAQAAVATSASRVLAKSASSPRRTARKSGKGTSPRSIRSASSAGSQPKPRTRPSRVKSAPKRTMAADEGAAATTPNDNSDYDDVSESSFEEEEGFAWKVACAFISALEVKERLVSPQFIVQGQRFCVRLKRFSDQKIGLHLVQTEQKRYWVHWTMRLLGGRDALTLEERDYMYDFDEYPNAGHKDFFDRVSLDDDNAELTIQVIFHHVRTPPNRAKGPLLHPPAPEHQNKPTLVLDLDETLIHSKFEFCPAADICVRVPIDGESYEIYVQTRPGVRGFLRRLSKLYELVIFTAGLDYYADAVLNELDQEKLITQRLYRQHCTQSAETYIKDLDACGRDPKCTILLDDSPQSFAFHPKNAILATSWFGSSNDRELFDMVTILEWLAQAEDVRQILDGNNRSPKWLLSQIT